MSTTRSERPTIVFGVTIDYQVRYHDGLYQRLADAGWDVHLVAGAGPLGERIGRHPGVSVHVLEMSRRPSPVADLRALRRWTRLLRSLRPDVVVVGTPKAGLLGGIASRLVGAPRRLYELHGLRLESASGVARRILHAMERLACAAATDVIAVGESLRARTIAEGIAPAAKVTVLGHGSPNGVDVDRFASARRDDIARAELREHLGIPADAPVITFIGRITADKGIDALAVAMAGVAERTPAWLVAVGGIDDASGEVGAQTLRDRVPRLALVGEVDDAAPYLAISDVLCLPSRREGLPTVVLEAFAAWVPVVAAQATGIVDLVTDGRTGRLSPIDDADALQDSLIDALTDTEASHRMTSAAAELVADRYSVDTVQSAWLATVERMRTGGSR